MSGELPILAIVRSLSLILTLVMAFLLFRNSTKERPSLLLGLFILFIGLESVPHLYNYIIGDEIELWNYMNPLNFYLLNPAILYLYFKRLAGNFRLLKEIKHIIPGVIELVVTSAFVFFPSLQQFPIEKYVLFLEIYYVAAGVVLLFYSFKILLGLDVMRKKLHEIYSQVERRQLKWLERVAFICIGMVALIWGLIFGLNDGTSMAPGYEALIMINKMVFMIYVTVSGLIQSSIFLPFYDEVEEENEFESNPLVITSKSVDKRFTQLQEIMRTEKLYLDPDLNAYQLADRLNVKQRVLSNIVRKNGHVSFNQYVNMYRVEEAKRLLTELKLENEAALAIGKKAGFNSQATFYTTFKRTTGTSPIEFKDSEKMVKE